jgi:hypothetical protein
MVQPALVIWLYDLISSWDLQEARVAERRKQEEYIKHVEVCFHKFLRISLLIVLC